MRALTLKSSGVQFERYYSPPPAADGEIPVRVLIGGICETDLQLIQGYMGFDGVLGHEFVGIAEEGEHAGKRVVGEINCPCRDCPACRAGQTNHCPNRTVVGILKHDGAFADRVWLPPENLHVLSDEIPTEVAVFAEPLAAAFQIPSQLKLDGSEFVVVLGDGRLGNLSAQVIHALGCRLLVVGKHPKKLDLLDRLGIETRLLDDVDLDHAADVVVDCTGSPNGITTALRLVRPLGTIVLKTTVAGEPPVSLAPVVIDEVTIVGSRCGPFPKALWALETGQIDVRPLISAHFPLEEGVQALEAAQRSGTLKVLLQINRE